MIEQASAQKGSSGYHLRSHGDKLKQCRNSRGIHSKEEGLGLVLEEGLNMDGE